LSPPRISLSLELALLLLPPSLLLLLLCCCSTIKFT